MVDRCAGGYAQPQHPALCDCPAVLEPPDGARHYGPHNVGGACRTCGTPIPAALPTLTEHPACDPDLTPMLAASRRNPTKTESRQ